MPLLFDCLIDNGSHLVLIHKSLVKQLQLRCRKLHLLVEAELTMRENDEKITVTLHEYVHLSQFDKSGQYSTQTICAIITLNLFSPVILGLPFLKHNKILVGHDKHMAMDKTTGFDLLNPSVQVVAQAPIMNLKNLFKNISATQKEVSKGLNAACGEQLKKIQHTFLPVKSVNSLNVVCVRIECLAVQAFLTALGKQVKTTYTDVFSKIPHINKLPIYIYA